MSTTEDRFYIALNGFKTLIGPEDHREFAYHQSLIEAEYDRCHPDDTFEDLKRRARFSKEDQGALKEWMSLAASRVHEQGRQELEPPRRAA